MSTKIKTARIDTIVFSLAKKVEYRWGFTTQKYRFIDVSARIQSETVAQ